MVDTRKIERVGAEIPPASYCVDERDTNKGKMLYDGHLARKGGELRQANQADPQSRRQLDVKTANRQDTFAKSPEAPFVFDSQNYRKISGNSQGVQPPSGASCILKGPKPGHDDLDAPVSHLDQEQKVDGRLSSAKNDASGPTGPQGSSQQKTKHNFKSHSTSCDNLETIASLDPQKMVAVIPTEEHSFQEFLADSIEQKEQDQHESVPDNRPQIAMNHFEKLKRVKQHCSTNRQANPNRLSDLLLQFRVSIENLQKKQYEQQLRKSQLKEDMRPPRSPMSHRI